MLREKYKPLFETELKNMYFLQADKDRLIVLIEYCVESLSFLYLMWYGDKIDRKLYKEMTRRSAWFLIHGIFLQIFVEKEWQPELASNVSEIITTYIVHQGLDLFGIRAGVIRIH